MLAAVPGSGVPEIPTVLEGETAPSESAPDDSYAEEMEEIKIITGVLSYGSIAPQNPPSQAKQPGGKPAKAPKKVKPKDYLKTVLKDSGKIALKSTEKHAAKYGKQILDDVVTGNFKDAAGAVKEMGTTSPKLAKHIGQELGKNAILRAQQIDFGWSRRRLLAAPGSGVAEIPTVLEGASSSSNAPGSSDNSNEEIIKELEEVKEVLHTDAINPVPPTKTPETKPEKTPAKAPKKVKPKDYMKTVLKDSGKIALKSTEKHAAKYGKQILDDVVTGNFKDAAGAVKEMGTTSPKLAKHIGQELGKNAILRAQQIDFGWSRRRLLGLPGSGVPEEAMLRTAEDDASEPADKASTEFRFAGTSQKVKSMNKATRGGRASKGGALEAFAAGAAGGAIGTGAIIVGSGLMSSPGPKYSCAKNAAPATSLLETSEARDNEVKFLEVSQHALFRADHKVVSRKGGKKGGKKKKSGVVKVLAGVGGAVAGGALALFGAKKITKKPKRVERFTYGTYQTWTDVEACEACSFVWNSVVNKANKWDRDELSTTFEDVCDDQPDIFAGPCKEMREKLNFMVSDLLAYKKVKPVCACADMGPCQKNAQAEKRQHLFGYV